MATIALIALLFFIFLAGSIVYWTIKNGISPMPSSRRTKKALLGIIPGETEGKIYELGSGWGTLLFPLSRRCPKGEVIGLETSWVPYWISKLRLFLSRRKNIVVRYADIYRSDLKDADLVICYLYPGAMRLLKGKFEKELKEGTLVVSNTFSIPGWKATQVVEIEDIYKTKVYLYTIGRQ